MIPLEADKVHDKMFWDGLTQQGEDFKAREFKAGLGLLMSLVESSIITRWVLSGHL